MFKKIVKINMRGFLNLIRTCQNKKTGMWIVLRHKFRILKQTLRFKLYRVPTDQSMFIKKYTECVNEIGP